MSDVAAAPEIRRVPATIGILIGFFLAAVEGTVVGTAMPSVIADLQGIHFFFLPFAVYMLTSTVTVPIFGRLSDIYGRKRFHLLGILVFLAGSALCGQARSMTTLIAFRALQGIGGGAIMPLSFTMIADLYPGEKRAKMQGAISGVWGIASVLGPPLGGFITKVLGWRYVFYVCIPFGILSLLIVQTEWKDVPRPVEKKSLDISGATLLLLASISLMAAFGMARNGWTSPATLGLFGLAALFVAILVVVERRSPDPFLAYDLFKSRIFWAGTLCGAFAAMCMFCVITYLPLFMQAVCGSTPQAAGTILTTMMLGWVGVSFMAFALLKRFSYRALALGGSTFLILGYWQMARLDASSTWGQAALASTTIGTGLGCLIAPLLIAAQNSVGRHKLGAATSLTQFSRAMVGALGVSVMGAVMSSRLVALLPGRPELVDTVVNPLLRDKLDPLLRRELVDVLSKAIHPLFLIGLGAAIMAFLAALLLPEGRAKELAAPVPDAGTARTPGSQPG